jgi:1-acyl-sn-glycerol-3-phosphate acyltransferase
VNAEPEDGDRIVSEIDRAETDQTTRGSSGEDSTAPAEPAAIPLGRKRPAKRAAPKQRRKPQQVAKVRPMPLGKAARRRSEEVLDDPEPMPEEEETETKTCSHVSARGKRCTRKPVNGGEHCGLHARREEPIEEPQPLARDEMALVKELVGRLQSLLRALGLGDLLGGISPAQMVNALGSQITHLIPSTREALLKSLRAIVESDYLDADTWRGVAYVVKNSITSYRENKEKRARGDYDTDDFGFDEDFFHSIRPISRFMYEYWWRVSVTGVENIPSEKRALLVPNHSGVLPFDGAMISEAIWSHHSSPRYVRWLFLKWFASLPFVSTFLARSGCVMACPENGERLLEADQLVGVFPEGLKGVGKLFRHRYQLARFGRGGFVKMAMRTRAPIIPISVVGAEEIYPALTYLEWLSRPLGIPMLPVTPTWPWLGVLGLIPLPSKWSIRIGKPIRFNESAPARANDYLIVSLLSERVRSTIQRQIDQQLAERSSVFLG